MTLATSLLILASISITICAWLLMRSNRQLHKTIDQYETLLYTERASNFRTQQKI